MRICIVSITVLFSVPMVAASYAVAATTVTNLAAGGAAARTDAPAMAFEKPPRLDSAWADILVQVKSTLDGTLQPCYFWAPEAAKTNVVPLVVGLHTWSADYRQTEHYATVLKYAREKGWAMVGPNFRGPNKTPPPAAATRRCRTSSTP